MSQGKTINEQFHDAIIEGEFEEVQRLVEQGADVNYLYGKHKTSMLNIAYYKRHRDIVRFLLDKGAKVNYNGFVEGTILMFAAGNGDLEHLTLFLKSGANPKVRLTVTGETALHTAAHRKNGIEAAKLLIEAGANVNEKTEVDARTQMREPKRVWGETPLHFAAHLAESEMINFLLKSGADKSIKTAQGETPLAYAERYQRPEEILRLLR